MGVFIYYQFLIVFIIIVLSLQMRMHNKKRSANNSGDQLPLDPLPSPFVRAMTEIIGMAGGIYLSLVMLVNFLDLELPPKVNIFGLEAEPLALLAIIISIVQPIFKNLFSFKEK